MWKTVALMPKPTTATFVGAMLLESGKVEWGGLES